MHQCMRAASSMLDVELELPSVPNLKKRKSASDLLEQAPKRVASMSHIPYQPRPPSRPQDQVQPLPQPSPQLPQHPPGGLPRILNIQPRPAPDANQPTPEGYGVFQSKTSSNGYGVFPSNPAGRKRGRPSKAEKEAQARANPSSHTTAGPVPISPKPGPQPPAASVAGPGAQYSGPVQNYTAAGPAESRDASGAGGMSLSRVVPQSYAEPLASTMRSEKSPSIGNLVTSDSPPEQYRSAPPPIVGPHTRDPPPVSNSA